MTENPMRKSETKEPVTICAWCGKKKEAGKWVEITAEASENFKKDYRVTHGVCPDCAQKILE